MATLRCAASSSASPQLRFGCRRRGPSAVAFLCLRFCPPRPRRVVFASASAPGSADGNRGEPLQSWIPGNGSLDAFAGWSDDGNGAGELRNNGGGLGGMLGMGLAGIIFAAGVAFAALSLANKSTFGGKQQMDPLTRDQEVLIASDDTVEEVAQNDDVSNSVLPDKEINTSNCNPESETGTIQNPNHPTEVIGDANEGRSDEMQNRENSLLDNVKSVNNDVDDHIRVSGQDDLEASQDVISSNVPFVTTDAGNFSSDTLENTNFLDVLKYAEEDVNLSSIATTVDLTSVDTDSKENATLHTEMPSSFTGEFEGDLSCKQLAQNVEMIDSGDHISPQLDLENLTPAEASVSKGQYVDWNDIVRPLDKDNTNHPVVPYIKEIVSSGNSVNLDSENEELTRHPTGSPGEYKSTDHRYFPTDSTSESSDANKILSVSHRDRESCSSSSFESIISKKSFSNSGIPAPSFISAAPQVPPGRVLVPPVVDQFQGKALAALQVLKVIEVDVQPGDLCTRREYARWLVSTSNVLSRNTVSKVYPAMYVENLTELAFDDITLEDPDFPYIQGLAEAGLISSKLSISDLTGSIDNQQDYFCFYPDRLVSRQDLVSWKMALDLRQLPEVDKNLLNQYTGFIDIEKINRDVWPALVADIAAGEQSIMALAFGYTRMFQPDKPVTKAQVAIALATGDAAEIVTEELARIEAEALAETAVNAHTALVEQVKKNLNSSFENELAREKEKTEALEKLAEEARRELDQLRTEREKENIAFMRGRAAVYSEIDLLSRIRNDMEEQLQSLTSDKLEISFEKERINKLLREAESENQKIFQLQYELEVERRALSMAKTWAEEEAKRAREQARALEEARERWEGHGIKVVVGEGLRNDASISTTWQTFGDQPPVDETIIRGESLVEKLKGMAAEMKLRSSSIFEKIIQKIVSLISALKQRASETSKHAIDIRNALAASAKSSIDDFQEYSSSFTITIGDRARRVVEECKDGVGRFAQKFKT